MKNIKKISLSAVILSFMLFSCKGFYSEQNKSNDPEKSDGKTYLVVGSATVVDTEKKADRTIIQNYIEELTDFELTGTISGGTEKKLASVPTFAKLSGAKIPLDAGTWDFTLKANLGEVQFSGSTGDIVIEAGKTNTISFELSAGEGFGGIQINMTFTGKADQVIVDMWDEDRTDTVNGTSRIFNTADFTPASDDPDNDTYSFTYKLDVADDEEQLKYGTYFIKFTFKYKSDTDPAWDSAQYETLNTYSAFVRVGNGINTKANLSIDLNEVYTITYDDNGGSLAANEVKVFNFSRKSEITLPQMDGEDEYTDFLGWYTDEDFDEDTKIEEIKNRTGNITLHARYRTPADVVSKAVNDILALTESGTVTVTGKINEGNIIIGQDKKTALKYIRGALDTLLSREVNVEDDSYNAQEYNATIKVTLDFGGVSGLTKIGNWVFEFCPNLQAITIPDGITTIGDQAFAFCSGLETVIIPDSVTAINFAVFNDCPKLETVSLPDSITTFGTSVFYNCPALKKADCLYENAYYVGNSTNKYVLLLEAEGENIENCTIHPDCKIIAYQAFKGCNEMTTLNIPAGVEILSNPLYYCKKIASITVDSANTNYCAVDGVLYSKDKTKLIQYPGGKTDAVFTIPASVTEIEEQSFNNVDYIQSVIIPQGMEEMCMAFNGCSGLKSVVIPSSVNTIGSSAFSSSSIRNLTDIYSRGVKEDIPESNIANLNDIFTTIYNDATNEHWHSNCKIITFDTTTNWAGNTVSIYPHVLADGSIIPLADDEDNSVSNNIITAQEYTGTRTGYTFKGWYTKATPETTDTAVNILNATLTADTTLYAVWEPITSGITVNISPSNDIELTASEIDTDTNTVTFTATLSGANSGTTYNWFVDGTKQTETGNVYNFTLPSTDIMAYTIEVISGTRSATAMVSINFVDIAAVTSQITNMTESGTVTISGVMGSSDLASLKTALTTLKQKEADTSDPQVLVTLDMSNVTGLKAIPANQFQYLNNIEGIILPEGLETIGLRAFEDCKKLSTVSIPDSLTSFGEWGFSRCISLTNITIPASMTTISAWAFNGCSNLTEVTIPETVRKIQKGAFAYCNGLATVTINEGVTEMSESIFQQCIALESITLPKSLTTLDKNVFIQCESLQEINVAEGNTYFSSQDGVLYNYAKTTLLRYPEGKEGTTFTIPSGVATIGQTSFYSCKNLTSIDITSGVQTIDYSAFFGCENLASVSIPDSVTTIRNQAFAGCAMTSVNISQYVTTIGSGAFMPNVDVNSYVVQFTPVLESITVDENNPNYSSQNGVLYNKDKTTILQYPGAKSGESFIIPSTVTTVNADSVYGAFEGTLNLKSVVIPDGVTTISQKTFSACNSLETITIPSSVTTIEAKSFEKSTNLKTVNYKGTATQKAAMTISDTTIKKSTVTWNTYKSAPDAVGDIVFNTGTALAYTDGMYLSQWEKDNAVAVIFYIGEECNNEGETGSRKLGVGINTTQNNQYVWASTMPSDITNIFNNTLCTPMINGTAAGSNENDLTKEGLYFTGKNNASTNWEYICSQDTEGTSSTNVQTNYPAFNWVNNYGTTYAASLGDNYKTGWYLPSITEEFMLFKVKTSVDNILQALGVSKITSPYNYWTSSFVYSWEDHSRVYSVSFQYNTFSQGLKTNECLLMVIREFN